MMGTKAGQRRKTARRAYRRTKRVKAAKQTRAYKKKKNGSRLLTARYYERLMFGEMTRGRWWRKR